MLQVVCFLRSRFWQILAFGLCFITWKTSEASATHRYRFGSLRSRLVNMHVGPGMQYPIIWQFVQSGLPVEVVGEFEHWRQIKDVSGSKGWVHKSLLCGKRTVYVVRDQEVLRKAPDSASPPVAYLQKGIVGKVLTLQGGWCFIQVSHANVGHYKGWVERKHVFGLYAHEVSV
jgi:SH3-like domain-containing protein